MYIKLDRTQHIVNARKLSCELRSAGDRFDDIDVTSLDAMSMWDAMQPKATLKAEFTRFLDDLYFDGIRSQFFGDFDAEKLILPIAKEVADRLDALADDLEAQLAKLTPSQVEADSYGGRVRRFEGILRTSD
jgi:hypothetical protein